MTSQEIWLSVAAGGFVAVVGIIFLWWRLPVYHWYCRRCRKIVSAGRFHPGKCPCGTHSLVAYYCSACRGWNTFPTANTAASRWNWQCKDCAWKGIALGAEYKFARKWWVWHNEVA